MESSENVGLAYGGGENFFIMFLFSFYIFPALL